jgi:hypothetical protein
LKQARQRASRRFTNDGARSSLLQYRHTNFFISDATRDDRGGRTLLPAFVAGAAFGWLAMTFFFGGFAALSVVSDLWNQ